jgi:death-on-curing protein
MQYLTLEEILRLHFQVIEDFGGAHGVRDENMLRSIAEAPKQEVFGQEQYPETYDKAAVYLRNIVSDHLFVGGNKRTAVTACGIFLMRNGIRMTATSKELENFAVQIATEHLDVPAIAAWLAINSN